MLLLYQRTVLDQVCIIINSAKSLHFPLELKKMLRAYYLRLDQVCIIMNSCKSLHYFLELKKKMLKASYLHLDQVCVIINSCKASSFSPGTPKIAHNF